jgi:peptidoglycan/xylan/chitin deacetylase (PgdA/CDA1 family)
MAIHRGSFVISLDFELMWGVRDVFTKETYGKNILGVQEVIPKLLNIFTEYQINATFATVGFVFLKDKEELQQYLPNRKPVYKNANLSPYVSYLDVEVGKNYQDDQYHFGWPLLEQIKKTPGQEIATHTFSHYYCLEQGQTIQDFESDLGAAIRVANDRNILVKSIVFPRNQVNSTYLDVCKQFGITSYRDNERSWIYKARNAKNESLVRRFFRLADNYINLTGHHCYTDAYMASSFPYNIASSRYLRPTTKLLNWLEWLRYKRITTSMTFAAKNNLTFHLWWHPHNFGINQDSNFHFLEKILKHYRYLNKKYLFNSVNMGELAASLHKKYGK